MTLTAIGVRVLLAYLFLLLFVRLSGKQTIGQATPIDFIAALILGDVMDDFFWAEVPAAQFVVAVGVLLLAHVLTAVGCTVSPRMGQLIHGVPVEVVRDGSVLRAGMRRERVGEEDVVALLRAGAISDRREVRSGTLEVSGQMGILQRDWAKEAQKSDLERVREAVR